MYFQDKIKKYIIGYPIKKHKLVEIELTIFTNFN